MLVPIKTVARKRRRVARIAVAHRQVQRHHRITTRGVGKGVRQDFRTRSYIEMLVPVETVASKGCRITRVAMPHRQMQRHHTITAANIGKGMLRCHRWG